MRRIVFLSSLLGALTLSAIPQHESTQAFTAGGGFRLGGDTLAISLTGLKVLRSLDSFVNGAHATLIDPPTSRMRVMRDVIMDRPNGITDQFLKLSEQLGLNGFRFFDGYWWNEVGAKAAFAVYKHFKMGTGGDATFVKRWDYPTAYDLIDFCGKHNLALSIVVSTIYWDQKTDSVYDTRQVANNDDGVLSKAAVENAGDLAAYYKGKGYTNKLILEIGNESIGFGRDLVPTDAQYEKIVVAYCEAVKAACSQVQTAVVSKELGYGKGAKPGYEYSYDHARFTRFLNDLKPYANLIDMFVIHLYPWNGYQVGLESVASTVAHLSNAVDDLDACGFNKAGIVITEYNESLSDPKTTRTYAGALDQTAKQIAMISNPRVVGIFVHDIVGTAFLDYSNGHTWASYPSWAEVPKGVTPTHLPDSHPDLGPRWRVLPDGAAVTMLSKVLHGNLYSFFEDGAQGRIASVITGVPGHFRILIMNNDEKRLNISLDGSQWTGELIQLTSISLGPASGQATQPWRIDSVNSDFNSIQRQGLPPYSISILAER